MIINNGLKLVSYKNNDIGFHFLETGDLSQITYQQQNISMYQANSLSGMVANIYMRLNQSDFTPLLGTNSPSNFCFVNQSPIVALYQGNFADVKYEVVLKQINYSWFWEVRILEKKPETIIELWMGQDISLNGPWMNEAYCCQYLDHHVWMSDNAYHITTKQNQGEPYAIQQGTLMPNVAYGTDGFQFFGLNYKFDGIPEAMIKGLPSINYQYEFAYIAFQSAPIITNDIYIFYAHFSPNYLKVELEKPIQEISFEYNLVKNIQASEMAQSTIKPLVSFQKLYPYYEIPVIPSDIMHNCEEKDGHILSWFENDGTHSVNAYKEHYVERPHGNIIINNGMTKIRDDIMTATNWIFGVFNSHIALGNADFNKMLSFNRNPLDVIRTSGQRLFIKLEGQYYLLHLPSLYQMTPCSGKWLYYLKKADEIVDELVVETVIGYEERIIKLSVTSKNNLKYDFIMTNQLVMGNVEYAHPIHVTEQGQGLLLTFDSATLASERYPNYAYYIDTTCDGTYEYSNDSCLYPDNESRNNPLLVIKYQQASHLEMNICGMSDGVMADTAITANQLKEEYLTNFVQNINHWQISNLEHAEFAKFNNIVYWYAHNALIHYASPHGLEQYGGGAWGTRDICQGPIEFFTTLGRFDLVREILKLVYSRQFSENGEWPQWFMFDRYSNIQAQDSHGDVIVWPLRALANYLNATADMTILNEVVGYTSRDRGVLDGQDTVMNHVIKQVATIQKSFIPGTHLPSYGGGDWDDTLQPCNHDLTANMVSGWTVLLLIETLNLFSRAVSQPKYHFLAQKIKIDYYRILVKDHVPAGFAYLKPNPELLLHPQDETSGIKYRLLPFNRGFIGEIFDPGSIDQYLDIIDQHLMHPDGIRLMNTTVKYRGGIPIRFIRAETATNFGREIGLLYIHAHLRYAEAMARLGLGERVLLALNQACPIELSQTVPNALTRQANMYFSSSDGAFNNRYEADAHFEDLRTGKCLVKGGWRLYSSGPGLYITQLIGNFLGIRMVNGELYLDPVSAPALDGTSVHYRYGKYELLLTYKATNHKEISVNKHRIRLNTNRNRYRTSGIRVSERYLDPNIPNEIIINF